MNKQTFKEKDFSEILLDAFRTGPKTSTYGDFTIHVCKNNEKQVRIFVTGKKTDILLDAYVTNDYISGKFSISSYSIGGILYPLFIEYIKADCGNVARSVPAVYIFDNYGELNKVMENLCVFLKTIQGM